MDENVDPSQEKLKQIAAAFHQCLQAVNEIPVPCDNDTSGTPIFTEEDISQSKNELDIILRTLFVKYGITRLMFTRMFQKCAVSFLNIAEMNINAQRENYLRAIKNGNITFPKFCRTLLAILGLRITKITLECLKFDGTKVKVESFSDLKQVLTPEAVKDQSPLCKVA